MNYSNLDELMAIKKKGESSKEKKSLFLKEMNLLLEEEGFSENAQKYLGSGFPFEGARPLAEYFSKCNKENMKESINTVLGSKLIKQNERGIAYKIALSLLGLLSVEYSDNKELISSLINIIPKKAKDSEGKYFKDASKNFERYFLRLVDPKFHLAPIEQYELKESVLNRFKEYSALMISEVAESKAIHKDAKNIVLKWINSSQEINASDNESCKKNAPEGENRSQGQNESVVLSEAEKYKNVLYGIAQRFEEISNELEKTKKDILELNKKYSVALIEKEQLNSSLNESEKKLGYMLNMLEEEARKNVELTNQIAGLQQEINEQKEAVALLNDEVNKRDAVISVYSSDKENSKSEQLNAIASKLKTEYRDFLDAEDMEMTADLGENMRLQLKSVFRILSKAGIDIEGR